MDTLEQLEKRLWGAADLLRANSNLNSSEYMMPVLGIIFLHHAYSRYLAVKARIEPTLPTRGGARLPLTVDHFTREAALYLRPEAQFDYLLALPGDRNLGKAINDAMTAIEEDYPAKLKGVLPKDYARLSDDLLRQLLKIFNDEALRRACEREFDARKADAWENAAISRLRKGLAEASEAAAAQLRQVGYFHRQAAWLQERFPDAVLRDVAGLVKVVTLAEIEAQDWSLTPGRYVGVAPAEEEEGFDFEQALREIHAELEGLNAEAAELAAVIQGNFEELV